MLNANNTLSWVEEGTNCNEETRMIATELASQILELKKQLRNVVGSRLVK